MHDKLRLPNITSILLLRYLGVSQITILSSELMNYLVNDVITL